MTRAERLPPGGGAEFALSVENVTVTYRNKPVLRHVSMNVGRGRMLAIVGPNGAGKSTLLKAILGLVEIDSGTVRVLDQPLAAMRQQVAYVPQTDTADWDFPISVREVVLMGRYGRLGWFGRPGPADQTAVTRALETVGMSDFADRHVRALSGGQQQRVFLARALAQEASVMLLDEPFAGVDARTETALFGLMDRFADEGKTLIVVNHNLQVLHRFDLVLLLNQRVIACGPPDEVVTAEKLQATYGGRMSFVDEAERQITEGPIHAR
ncbi:MAG: metal ABC transporter ATP-binding protein [Phycisphaerales bacterium]|nr:metal ABC transporter ATP-binding protein [Phycisphaerales bacterium]